MLTLPNRSIENQLDSAWNSYPLFVVQWCLNFSTDLLRMFIEAVEQLHLTFHLPSSLLLSVLSSSALEASPRTKNRSCRRLFLGRHHFVSKPWTLYRVQCDGF